MSKGLNSKMAPFGGHMSLIKSITANEYLMGRSSVEDLTDELESNMSRLLSTVNSLLEEFGEYRKVNSGYRRPIDNRAAGGGSKSAHLTCQAVDLEDKNGKLQAFCTQEILEKYDLYMEEDPKGIRNWVHLQTRPTRWGNRVFIP